MVDVVPVLGQLVKETDDALPEDSNGNLGDKFATFFDEKIAKIRKDTDNVTVLLIEPPPVRAVRTENLSCLPQTSCEEVNKIIMAWKSKSCCLDVIPTDILKKTLPAHSQIRTRLVNISFTTCEFPQVLKKAVVTPLIKKVGFDLNTLQNYRPVSKLPFHPK